MPIEIPIKGQITRQEFELIQKANEIEHRERVRCHPNRERQYQYQYLAVDMVNEGTVVEPEKPI